MRNLLFFLLLSLTFISCDKEPLMNIDTSTDEIKLIGTKWIVQIIESDEIYEVNTLTDGTSDLYTHYENFMGDVNYSQIEFLSDTVFSNSHFNVKYTNNIELNQIKLYEKFDHDYHVAIVEYYLEDNNLIFLYDGLKITHYPVN